MWTLIILVTAMIILAGLGTYIIAKITLKNSLILKELAKINSKTKYRNIVPKIYKCYTCFSRAEFNHFSLENYFLEILTDDNTYYKKIITDIEYNKRALSKYNKSISSLDFLASQNILKQLGIPFSIFKLFEQYFFKKKQHPLPSTNIQIICKKEYTSPAGRTHVSSSTTFNYNDLKQYIKKSETIIEQCELRKYHIERERSLMTNSLRYDILNRDGFKCQICGSTKDDGVKLHVDHIIPVSKGGRTVPDNLRTLCDRCNSGKSDKIETSC